jgi:aspartate 1-decarboxylase
VPQEASSGNDRAVEEKHPEGDEAMPEPIRGSPGPVRSMLKSKIHRVTVTQADLYYEGSLTLDGRLLEAADILPFEEVQVWNVTRGTRFSTYAMEGERGSGVVCVNGAAAHLAHPGDVLIVATYTPLEDAAARTHRPKVVLVDPKNRIQQTNATEVAGPARR